MDAVPGEPETMISSDLRGVVVLRSLTKTWGLAGLRAGYAVGDAEVIAAMAAQQPPWSVSTPALAAIAACLSDQARELAAAAAEEIARHRGVLVAGLESIGLAVAGTADGPLRPGRHQADPRAIVPRWGPGQRCVTMGSPYAGERPSRVWARTGSASPFATRSPPRGWSRPCAG